MRAELQVSLRYDVILQMAAAGQSNQRRFTIFFIFQIVKFVSWMSWCWQTLTTRTSASSAADGCYCCRMTWRQYCPTVQLQAFFFAAWSKFVFITCSNNKALALFFMKHLSFASLSKMDNGASLYKADARCRQRETSVLLCRLHSAALTSSTLHHIHVMVGWCKQLAEPRRG